MKKFEYKILFETISVPASRIEQKLNSLGEEGWELVGVQAVNQLNDSWYYTFKKAVQTVS